MGYEIEASWKNITPICGCHGDERIEMVIQQGPHSLFYACPKYHPENRKPGEKACNNRINLIEYQKMLEKLMGEIAEADCTLSPTDLTNLRWKSKGIEFVVLEHDGEKAVVSIKNVRAMKM